MRAFPHARSVEAVRHLAHWRGASVGMVAAEAFVLNCMKLGMEGNGAANRAYMTMSEQAKSHQSPSEITTIVRVIVDPASVTSALQPLRMAMKLDAYRETARMVLEPWLVEAALARISEPLSPTDQRIIVKATRMPRKVQWPKWWSELP